MAGSNSPKSGTIHVAAPGLPKKRGRTVQHLTEDQIQHKRSIDRKAQRAFRQRTKNCIENLEHQFAELQETCSQREKELQVLRRQNDTMLRSLESIAEIASSAARQAREDAAGAEEGPDSPNPMMSSDSVHVVETARSPSADPVPEERQTRPGDFDTNDSSQMVMQQGDLEETSQPQHGPEYPANPLPTHHRTYSHHSTYQDSQSTLHSIPSTSTSTTTGGSGPSPGGSYNSPGFSSHEEMSLNSQPIRSTGGAAHIGHVGGIATPVSTMTASSSYYYSKPNSVCGVLPAHILPTCPLDQILLDFLNSRRQMNFQGVSMDTILGPHKPSVKVLFEAESSSSVHPLSGVLSEVLSTFPNVNRMEKLGFFYLMYHTMKWQISPTTELYSAMPTWLRPTVTQITVQHAMWIDNIPWPGVRDILIEKSEDYPFELFSEWYSQNVKVNWVFDEHDAISNRDNDCVTHSIYEKHIRNLKNWTVSPKFLERFPEMASAIYVS